MNRLHLRYLLTSLIVSAALALLMQTIIFTMVVPKHQDTLAGAAFIAGWWGNLLGAFMIALMAARKASSEFDEPRIGRLVGTVMGFWVGIGAFIGNAVAAAIFASTHAAAVRPGLVIVFGLVSLVVAVVAAALAGREAAQPAEEEIL